MRSRSTPRSDAQKLIYASVAPATRSRMQAVRDLLRAPPWQSLENERSVAEEFVALDTLHAAITQSVQELNARQASELQARVNASRSTVMHQLVGAIVLALVLALSLGLVHDLHQGCLGSGGIRRRVGAVVIAGSERECDGASQRKLVGQEVHGVVL